MKKIINKLVALDIQTNGRVCNIIIGIMGVLGIILILIILFLKRS